MGDWWTQDVDLVGAHDLTATFERRLVRAHPTPSPDEALVEPRDHRVDVIRRLLEMQLSVQCLRALLPEWSALIAAVAEGLDREQTEEDAR